MEMVSWQTGSYRNGKLEQTDKKLATEICYTIHLNRQYFRSFYCSPWDLEDLVAGMLYKNRVILSWDEITSLVIDHDNRKIEVAVSEKKKGFLHEEGQCQPGMLRASQVNQIARKLDEASRRFRLTGGVHSAAISDGEELLLMREDVGRHNVLMKLLGACIRQKICASDKIIVFSGRIAAEILEIAVCIGCPVFIAVSAPTSKACEIALDHNVMLIGFARGDSFNIYTFPERLADQK